MAVFGHLLGGGHGLSVQVAHRIGAGDFDGARRVLRQALTAVLAFGLGMAGVGMGISGALPRWLGGDEAIRADSSAYFFIYSLFLPVLQMHFLAGGMLRCSGNMRVPSLLSVLMCVLDVIFNFLFIFPTRTWQAPWGRGDAVGRGLGVEGRPWAPCWPSWSPPG